MRSKSSLSVLTLHSPLSDREDDMLDLAPFLKSNSRLSEFWFC